MFLVYVCAQDCHRHYYEGQDSRLASYLGTSNQGSLAKPIMSSSEEGGSLLYHKPIFLGHDQSTHTAHYSTIFTPDFSRPGDKVPFARTPLNRVIGLSKHMISFDASFPFNVTGLRHVKFRQRSFASTACHGAPAWRAVVSHTVTWKPASQESPIDKILLARKVTRN